jgi:hypothetical protein
VPDTWTDTVPGAPGQPPGFLERRQFINGDDWHYELYLGWHVR